MESHKKCRQTKLIYPGPDNSKNTGRSRTSRTTRITTIYIQAISGQNNLNYLNNLIIPEHTDQCRLGEEEEESFAHLVGECPVFMLCRQKITGGLGRDELDKLSLRQLMQFIKNNDVAVALATNVTENLVKNRL